MGEAVDRVMDATIAANGQLVLRAQNKGDVASLMGSCAFYHQRRTRTEDGRIYEYTCSYIRGDRVTLDVHMQKNNMTFNRTVR